MLLIPLLFETAKTTAIECFLYNNRESFSLYIPSFDCPPVRFWEAEPGQAAADFLYDNNFEYVIDFLKSGDRLIKEINRAPSV